MIKDVRRHYIWVDSVDGNFLFRSVHEAVDYAAEHLQHGPCSFWRGSLIKERDLK